MQSRGVSLTFGLLLAVGPALAADELIAESAPPNGLEEFIEATVLESGGRYRSALIAYEKALEAQPDLLEVRVRYASLLSDLGMADRAVAALDGVTGLDWYGSRVRALALAQLAGRRTERLDEATLALRSVLEEREDDPNLQLSLAQVLHRQGQLEEAEELVAELRQKRGSSLRLIAYHAELLDSLGRQQEAAVLYTECATADRAPPECRQRLVEILVELGRPGEAGELMLSWLDDQDLDDLLRAASLLLEGGRDVQALRVVRRILVVAPDSPRALRLEAFILSSLGDYQGAATRLRELLRGNRNDIDLILGLAWATARSGDQQEARKWIDRAWELVSDDAGSSQAVRVALAAARVELASGHPGAAREWLDRVGDTGGAAGEELVALLVESYRSDEDWEAGTSALLRLQPHLDGRAQRMARAFEAEFRLRTGDNKAWRLLRPLLDSEEIGDVLMGLQILQGLQRWEEVAREAAAAGERFPADRNLVFTRGAALERLGRFDEAEAAFQVLVERDPSDASAANYLGYTWADRSENLAEALELISTAVALEPENPAYLDSLGWVYYRLGDLDQAEYWLRRAIGFDATDGTLLSHLGEVMLERGELDEARRLLGVALDIGCEHPEHVQNLLDGLRDGD